MRLLFDTSVLVAALVETHPAYAAAHPWLVNVLQGSDTGVICSHSLAELYANLTRLPLRPRHLTPLEVQRLLDKNIYRAFEIVPLSSEDYRKAIHQVAAQNLVSGIIYDALIVYAGLKANADRILTLNPRHLRLIYPALADRILDPTEANAP